MKAIMSKYKIVINKIMATILIITLLVGTGCGNLDLYIRFVNDVKADVNESSTEITTTKTSIVEVPSTEVTTTEEPTTEEPTTEKPTTEEPTMEVSTAEEPTIETPTAEEPTIETPTTEEPTTETPTIEKPTTEEPTTGEPTTEEPTTEEPTTEEPTTEEPTTEPDYVIIDEVYKVKNGVLIEYLGDMTDEDVTALVIPKEVRVIDKGIFEEYRYIKKVQFEEGSELIEIGEAAFKDCISLTKITLPTGLIKIGYRAFGRCTSLKSLKIPATVTEGDRIFGTINSVTSVTFKKGTKSIPNSILKYAYSVKKVTMYSGVTSIGAYAFYECKALDTIELPDTVKTIGKSGFYGCEELTNFELNKVTSIGKNTFKKCIKLEKLVLNKTVSSIGTNAFKGDDKLTLKVYANSYGKSYAIKNNIKWEYTASEVKRRAKNQEIYDIFKENLSIKDSSKFKLKRLDDYVPQGLCIISKYVVVSMYHKDMKKNSILLVYDKSTGAYIKRVVLPSKDHVGSITNVEGRLVVGLCDISATDYVAVINKSSLKKIKSGKTIKYNYKIKLSGYVDFASYDGKYYWAGRSGNVSNTKMYGYKVSIKNKKLKFTYKYSYAVPKNVQGLIVKKGKGTRRTFIFSKSYGRINNSSLITYNVKLKGDKTLGNAAETKVLPSMLEGICMNTKGNIFMVFESAAGLYCGNPDNTSEIKIKNICKIKEANLIKLKNGS